MRSPLSLLLGVGAMLQLATCSDRGPTGAEAPFRVVFIADTHLIGPQYECCSESPGVDNTSIVRTRERFIAVRDTINAITPRPDMVFVLGDVMHAAYHSSDPVFYESNETAFSIASELFADLEVPVHFVWGNHDYEVDCGRPERSYSRELSHQLFSRFFATPPYQAIDHKGWKFILANGMLGRSWDAADPDCDASCASYGPEQLRWIDVSTLGTPHEPEWVVAATRYDGEPMPVENEVETGDCVMGLG